MGKDKGRKPWEISHPLLVFSPGRAIETPPGRSRFFGEHLRSRRMPDRIKRGREPGAGEQTFTGPFFEARQALSSANPSPSVIASAAKQSGLGTPLASSSHIASPAIATATPHHDSLRSKERETGEERDHAPGKCQKTLWIVLILISARGDSFMQTPGGSQFEIAFGCPFVCGGRVWPSIGGWLGKKDGMCRAKHSCWPLPLRARSRRTDPFWTRPYPRCREICRKINCCAFPGPPCSTLAGPRKACGKCGRPFLSTVHARTSSPWYLGSISAQMLRKLMLFPAI